MREMEQLELIPDTRSLFEKLCSVEYLRQGFRAVKANRGSPGIDGVSIREFEERLQEELAHLKKELQGWSYEPKPVRRVEIPKPGGSGVRISLSPTHNLPCRFHRLPLVCWNVEGWSSAGSPMIVRHECAEGGL